MYDVATGLSFMNARYYDPASGRFLSEDPLGFAAGDMNVYRYVGNNPVNLVDPTGLEAGPAQKIGVTGNTGISTIWDYGGSGIVPGGGISQSYYQSGYGGANAYLNTYNPANYGGGANSWGTVNPAFSAPLAAGFDFTRRDMEDFRVTDMASATTRNYISTDTDFNTPRVQAAVGMVGGVAEVAAGYSLATAVAATGWTGVGLVGVGAGLAVGGHGVDQFQANFRSMTSGEQVRSYTSQSLDTITGNPQYSEYANSALSIIGTGGAALAAPRIAASTAARAGMAAPSTVSRQTMATGSEWYEYYAGKYGAQNVDWVSGSGRTITWPSELPMPANSQMFRVPSPPRSSTFVSELESVAGPRPPGGIGHHNQPLGLHGVDNGATNGSWQFDPAHQNGHNPINSAVNRLPYGTEIRIKPGG